MPKKESLQHKLDRVRPPRVQITYDVEVGDAIELKELPFVMGVLGDFTGHAQEGAARLKDRLYMRFTVVLPAGDTPIRAVCSNRDEQTERRWQHSNERSAGRGRNVHGRLLAQPKRQP